MPRKRPTFAPLSAAFALLAIGACAPAARTLPTAPTPAAPVTEELGAGPEIGEEVRVAGRDLLGSVAYDLPVEANTWVEKELDYLVGQRASVLGRWMERGEPYEAFIKSTLADYGLPTDLYHLAMIESGFVPNARSRAGAVGLWQFMPATARMEGLRVDDVVDERMDPIRSTHAAARHLRSLHRSFGDWALAAAAYNAGSGRISRGMQGFGATNFWDLAQWGDLAEETRHYVPRLYAVTIVARDRTRFGFLERPGPSPALAFDSVRVDLPIPLGELARIGGVEEEHLVRLNPHLVQRTTPAGNYLVWVPAGTGVMVQQAFLDSDFRRDGGMSAYVVRRGDSLGGIATRTGIPSSQIRQMNPRTNWDRLPVGSRIRLPGSAVRTLAAAPERAPSASEAREAPRAASTAARAEAAPARGTGRAAAAPAAKENGTSTASAADHRVASGETLWSISRRYGVSVDEIQKANRLGASATIVPGRTLKIPGAARALAAETGTARKTAAAREPEPASAQHVVRAGETLWSIAREYGSTVDSIQTANSIVNNTIVPGQTLLIPR